MTARETLAAYERVINAHDFSLLLEMIAPDATFWFSDGTHREIAEIRAAFERTWAAFGPDEHYWLDQHDWIAEGDNAAICIYRYKRTSGGQSGSGRGTTVLSRRSGRWQIAHEHLSPNPAQAPAPTTRSAKNLLSAP